MMVMSKGARGRVRVRGRRVIFGSRGEEGGEEG